MLKQEKIFLKLSLIISLLGIVILILISNKISPETAETTIDQLKSLELNSEVSIAGEIISVIDTPTILIINIKDPSGSIKVIADKKSLDKTLNKGAIIEIQGELKKYNEELEVEANKITIFWK